MLAFYIYKQEQELAKDFLIFTPIIENISPNQMKKDHLTTLYYRPLTAGESMEYSPLTNNKNDTSPSTHITKEAVIDAYQTLSSKVFMRTFHFIIT